MPTILYDEGYFIGSRLIVNDDFMIMMTIITLAWHELLSLLSLSGVLFIILDGIIIRIYLALDLGWW